MTKEASLSLWISKLKQMNCSRNYIKWDTKLLFYMEDKINKIVSLPYKISRTE